MLPIRTAAHRLDRYLGTDNLSRARTIEENRRTVRSVAEEPGLSIVILTLNKPELILPMIEWLTRAANYFEQQSRGLQVIIGDTGSTNPEVLEAYKQLPDGVEVVRDLKFQFSRSNNDTADGRVRCHRVLFLNNDVIFDSPEQLWRAYQVSLQPGIGVVGLVMDFPDGTIQHSGIDVIRSGDSRGLIYHAEVGQPRPDRTDRIWDALAVTGACLFLRTELWQSLSGFDEAYDKECQDIDLCLRAHRLGERIVVADVGRVVHIENATREPGEEHWPDRRLLLRRWESYLEASGL